MSSLSSSLYKQQQLVSSELLPTNPRYAAILEASEAPVSTQQQPLTTATRMDEEQLRAVITKHFHDWARAHERIEKCKCELQRHKESLKFAESNLKAVLLAQEQQQKNKTFVVPFPVRGGGAAAPRPAFLSIEEEVEQKRAFSAKLIRELLRQQLGEEKGNDVFTYLNENRGTLKRGAALKIRKTPLRYKKNKTSS